MVMEKNEERKKRTLLCELRLPWPAVLEQKFPDPWAFGISHMTRKTGTKVTNSS